MKGNFIQVLFLLFLVFSLVSCGGDNDDGNTGNNADDAGNTGNTADDSDDIADTGDTAEGPGSRVTISLTWKQGFKSVVEAESGVDGAKIDLDLHLIKRESLEAPEYGYTPLEGLMGTNARTAGEIFDETDPSDYRFFRHDDCSFSDKGIKDGNILETIEWNAALEMDSTWGGNNYGSPEKIALGSLKDTDGDKWLDKGMISDQYLVVVNYTLCTSKYADGINRCDKEYSGEDSAYEVDARVQITVDGAEVPRAASGDRPADNFSADTKDFKIRWNEWKVIAVIKWDGSLPAPDSDLHIQGDAIVSDVAMPDEGITTDASAYKICNFSYTDAILVPIWNEQAYYDFVNAQRDPEDENSPSIGECY
ncbi:MAG TPA: hypothetical protein P5044_02455 [bacterium]|nr:hypothetical protein [bacterium]